MSMCVWVNKTFLAIGNDTLRVSNIIL